mmetsp:Transcript_10914/g.17164  ORF Transcript_10914/g.17164 Transcript_10914/m.17164 type:complete len:89 (-) Transcript_10914:945-1211(-)
MASNGIIVLEGDAVPTGGVPPPLEENEKMAYIKQRVQLFINSRPSEGPGTLYLTTENLGVVLRSVKCWIVYCVSDWYLMWHLSLSLSP